MKKFILILLGLFIVSGFVSCAKKVDTAQQRYEYQRANGAAQQAHRELDRE